MRDAHDPGQRFVVGQGAHLAAQFRVVEQQAQRDDQHDAGRHHPEEDIGQRQPFLLKPDFDGHLDALVEQIGSVHQKENDVTQNQSDREGSQDQRVHGRIDPRQRPVDRAMTDQGDQRRDHERHHQHNERIGAHQQGCTNAA